MKIHQNRRKNVEKLTFFAQNHLFLGAPAARKKITPPHMGGGGPGGKNDVRILEPPPHMGEAKNDIRILEPPTWRRQLFLKFWNPPPPPGEGVLETNKPPLETEKKIDV